MNWLLLEPVRRLPGVMSVMLLLATLLTGCAAPLPVSERESRQRLSQLNYPADAEWGPDRDIVVRREGDRLTLINRTPQTYRDVRLWLNQQYVRELALIQIGPDNRFDLTRWINEHQEPFPVGSLLAPDKAFPVVLAEMIDPDTGLRHRLLVWPDETEF